LKKDLMISPDSFLIVELKDNATLCRRLGPDDTIFKGYLNQLCTISFLQIWRMASYASSIRFQS
jgi:hypothetical protein